MTSEVDLRKRPKRFWRSDWRLSDCFRKLKNCCMAPRAIITLTNRSPSRCSEITGSYYFKLYFGSPGYIHRGTKTALNHTRYKYKYVEWLASWGKTMEMFLSQKTRRKNTHNNTRFEIENEKCKNVLLQDSTLPYPTYRFRHAVI